MTTKWAYPELTPFCAIDKVDEVKQDGLTPEKESEITRIYDLNYVDIQKELKGEITKFLQKEYEKSS